MNELEQFSQEHQKELQKMADLMTKGDPRSRYKIGTRVVKKNSEKDDLTLDGTKGTVMGNLRVLKMMDNLLVKDIYMVQFDGQDNNKFTIDCKLRKLIFGIF